jgi:hypothetical protein
MGREGDRKTRDRPSLRTKVRRKNNSIKTIGIFPIGISQETPLTMDRWPMVRGPGEDEDNEIYLRD